MQISASTFSDPAMRDRLKQYYDDQKAALYDKLKVRESQKQPTEVKMRTANGDVSIGKPMPFSADKMIGAMVSFDKWLEMQAQSFDNPVAGPEGVQRAQAHLDRLTANSPDSPSGVQSTFANAGSLLAYINEDGTAVLSSAAQTRLQPVLDRADRLNLSGQQRIDYLNQQFGAVLSDAYPALKTGRYDAGATPSKREFAQMWSPGHDVDQHYNDAMAAAQVHFDHVSDLNQKWQGRMNEIGSFLMGLQEA